MLYYQIATLNVPFDNTYENVLRFDSRTDQEAYFKVGTLFINAANVNFKVSSLLYTTITYQADSDDLNALMSRNYCIVKDNSAPAVLQYYYYFINRITQDSGRQITLELELDIFQTYYLELNIMPCRIRRAHLDRFIKIDNNLVSFNAQANSPLFEQEDLQQLSKRFISRQVINLNRSSEQPLIDAWVKENIIGWVYIFVNPSYAVNPFNENFIWAGDVGRGGMPTPYRVLFYPLCKKTITVTMTQGAEPYYLTNSKDIIAAFITAYASNILDMRISPMPPFIFDESSGYKFTIKDDGKTLDILNNSESYSSTFKTRNISNLPSGSSGAVCGFLNFQDVTRDSNLTYKAKFELEFNKAEIISAKRNKKYNPKLLSANFIDLKLVYGTSTGYNYDIQKLGTNELLLSYVESLTPGITRSSIFIEGGKIYQDTKRSYVGCNVMQDTSLPFSINQLEQYLSQNKNFFLTRNINTGIGALGGVAQGIGAGLGLIGGSIGSLFNTGIERLQSNLTLDNMRSAPENIQNANGNVGLNFGVNGLEIFIEIWQALDHELNIADDIMYLTGYTYNRVDNIKDCDNIRENFNFVNARPEIITHPAGLSEAARQKFKDVFNKGVRFWNNDKFDYEKENYERWLNG